MKSMEHGVWCYGCEWFEVDATYTGGVHSLCRNCGCEQTDHETAHVVTEAEGLL